MLALADGSIIFLTLSELVSPVLEVQTVTCVLYNNSLNINPISGHGDRRKPPCPTISCHNHIVPTQVKNAFISHSISGVADSV